MSYRTEVLSLLTSRLIKAKGDVRGSYDGYGQGYADGIEKAREIVTDRKMTPGSEGPVFSFNGPVDTEVIQRHAYVAMQKTNRGIVVVAERDAWNELRDNLTRRSVRIPDAFAYCAGLYLATPTGELEVLMLSRPGKRWAIYPEMV